MKKKEEFDDSEYSFNTLLDMVSELSSDQERGSQEGIAAHWMRERAKRFVKRMPTMSEQRLPILSQGFDDSFDLGLTSEAALDKMVEMAGQKLKSAETFSQALDVYTEIDQNLVAFKKRHYT